MHSSRRRAQPRARGPGRYGTRVGRTRGHDGRRARRGGAGSGTLITMTGPDGGAALTQIHDEAVRPEVDAPAVVVVEEPAQPDRIRRTSDAIRFVASLAGLAAVLLLVSIAQQTTHGLQTDIEQGTAHAPRFLLTLATL